MAPEVVKSKPAGSPVIPTDVYHAAKLYALDLGDYHETQAACQSLYGLYHQGPAQPESVAEIAAWVLARKCESLEALCEALQRQNDFLAKQETT